MVVVDIRYIRAEAKVRVLPLTMAILGGLGDGEERGVALVEQRLFGEDGICWSGICYRHYVVYKPWGAKPVRIERYNDRKEAFKSFFERLGGLFDAQGLEEEVRPEYIDNGYIRNVHDVCREVLWLWWYLTERDDRPTHVVEIHGVDGDTLMVLHYRLLDVMKPLEVLVDEKEIEI